MLTRYASLALFLLLVVAASFLATGFEAGEWYHVTMKQPSLTLPHWLFGPAWALVYATMAVAAWQVWTTGRAERTGALAWWVLLLVLSVVWVALFFGVHRPGWALPVIALALGFAVFCLRAFGRLSREAALMMVPCLLWLAYIFLFNLLAWTLNGGLFERFL